MAENQFDASRSTDSSRNEPVCIDAKRVYDSCGDKDCLSDMRVFFTPSDQEIIDTAVNARLRDADVLNVIPDIEPVPFHRGFYSIDMTYFFEVTLDVFSSPCTAPTQVRGLCVSDKKVILYGSEGNVKVFSSDYVDDDFDTLNMPTRNLPIVNVQVARPIALASHIRPKKHHHGMPCKVPEHIIKRFGSEIGDCGEKEVSVTLGVFSIIQLMRDVQMLIPAYDFCIPEKSCDGASDSPCEMFSRLDFPTDEFFPPSVSENQCECGCSGRCNN